MTAPEETVRPAPFHVDISNPTEITQGIVDIVSAIEAANIPGGSRSLRFAESNFPSGSGMFSWMKGYVDLSPQPAGYTLRVGAFAGDPHDMIWTENERHFLGNLLTKLYPGSQIREHQEDEVRNAIIFDNPNAQIRYRVNLGWENEEARRSAQIETMGEVRREGLLQEVNPNLTAFHEETLQQLIEGETPPGVYVEPIEFRATNIDETRDVFTPRNPQEVEHVLREFGTFIERAVNAMLVTKTLSDRRGRSQSGVLIFHYPLPPSVSLHP